MNAQAFKKRTKKEKGFALLTVLAAILVLSALVLRVHFEGRVERRLASVQTDWEQARVAAGSGASVARRLIAEDDADVDGALDLWALPLEFEQEGIEFSITIQDEDGKLGLGDFFELDREEQKRRQEEMARLARGLRQSDNFAAALLDWIDEDDQPRMGGAESSAYFQAGYVCKNRDLDSILEIYRVRGALAARPEDSVAWEDYLSSRSASEVNVNTASSEVLGALSEKLDPALLQAILLRRSSKPFQKVSDLKNVPGLSQEVYNSVFDRLTVSSSRFTIHSRAMVRGTGCTVVAEVQRSGEDVKLVSWSVR